MPFTKTEKQSLSTSREIAPAAFRCLQEIVLGERAVKAPLFLFTKEANEENVSLS